MYALPLEVRYHRVYARLGVPDGTGNSARIALDPFQTTRRAVPPCVARRSGRDRHHGATTWHHRLGLPLHVAGALFPGWQLAGLILGLVALAAASAVVTSCRAVTVLLALTEAVGIAQVCQRKPVPPPSWVAIDTQFGKFDQSDYNALLARSQAAMHEAGKAFDMGANVVILPEETVGLWRPSTQYWWTPYLAHLASGSHTIVLGVDLPITGNVTDLLPGNRELRYTDSAMVAGATLARFDSRQPVPGGLWRPGAPVSAERGSLAQPYVVFDGRRTALSICFEDLLLWPHCVFSSGGPMCWSVSPMTGLPTICRLHRFRIRPFTPSPGLPAHPCFAR